MNGAIGLGTWATRSVAPVLAASLPVHCQEVQRDRRPTGSLELHGRRGSQNGPKYPRRTLAGETLWPRRGGQRPIGNQLGKGSIESGIFPDGSDTIPGLVPAQGTQLKEIGQAE